MDLPSGLVAFHARQALSGMLALSFLGIAHRPATAQATVRPKTEIIYVEPAEGDYIGMILGATAWAKDSISKSLGVLQLEAAAPAWKSGVEAAAERHGLKVIALENFAVSCYTRQATRSTPSSRVCSMKGVDAVLQFNTVRVAGDSGAMVMSVTRVPKTGSRTVTTHYCLTFARAATQWLTLGSTLVTDPDRCLEPAWDSTKSE